MWDGGYSKGQQIRVKFDVCNLQVECPMNKIDSFNTDEQINLITQKRLGF